jgi:glycogen debranching enzyme
MQSAEFLGHPDLHHPLPPSTSPEDAGFIRRSYWRGPFWPIITWLLWWSLGRAGEMELAGRLREMALTQISEHGFGEYFDPFTGESLGASRQSWTAAVVLEWFADEPDVQETRADATRQLDKVARRSRELPGYFRGQ